MKPIEVCVHLRMVRCGFVDLQLGTENHVGIQKFLSSRSLWVSNVYKCAPLHEFQVNTRLLYAVVPPNYQLTRDGHPQMPKSLDVTKSHTSVSADAWVA